MKTFAKVFGPLLCLPNESKFLFTKRDSNYPLPIFGACISKVLLKNIQNTIVHFYIFLFLLCLAWQMCLCTQSICFHPSSADTNMQHVVLAFLFGSHLQAALSSSAPLLQSPSQMGSRQWQVHPWTYRMGNFMLRWLYFLQPSPLPIYFSCDKILSCFLSEALFLKWFSVFFFLWRFFFVLFFLKQAVSLQFS